MITIVVRATKDAQLDLARKWGFPSTVFADATFGLGVTLMHETGHTEEQIVEMVRQLLAGLSASPSNRGAS